MRKVVINADDFGLATGCNRGILRALTTGMVTDTTLLVHATHAREAVSMAQEAGVRAVGLHLNLTCGRPVLPPQQVPSLVDANGMFTRTKGNLPASIDITEVEREFRAQLLLFRQTGLVLSHLDSHHHVHARPEIIAVAVQLAGECRVPLRQIDPTSQQRIQQAGVKTTDHFTMDFYNTGVNEKHLQQLMLFHDTGTLEIMSHPAEYDPELYQISSYHACREQELSILTSDKMKRWVLDHDIELIGFQQV